MQYTNVRCVNPDCHVSLAPDVEARDSVFTCYACGTEQAVDDQPSRYSAPRTMRVVISDIDGTLANNSHRQWHLRGPKKKDWKAFYEGLDGDTLIQPVAGIVRASLSAFDAKLVCTTGRPYEYYDRTLNWLRDVFGMEPWAMYMRQDGDSRPDHVVKQEMLVTIRAVGFEPVVVFDDRSSVVKMWRDNGLVCLQVAEGDF